jgi:hypothetical protein
MPTIHEPITQALSQTASAPAHPEEIRAKVKLRLGKRNRLNTHTPHDASRSRERRYHDGRHSSLDRRLGAGGAPALLADHCRR